MMELFDTISLLTFFFKILSCMGPYIYDVHMEGGVGGGGGEGLGSWNLARVYESTDLLFIFADGKWVGGQKLFLFFLWTS